MAIPIFLDPPRPSEAASAIAAMASSEVRLSMASAAVGEIAVITQALRAHIAAHEPDLCGPIAMLSRGLLARIEDLTDVIEECLHYHDGCSNDELRMRVLEPRSARALIDQSRVEVLHG